MTRDSSTGSLQRMHRLRRIVAWVLVVVLGLTLTSLAFGTTSGSSAQGRAQPVPQVMN